MKPFLLAMFGAQGDKNHPDSLVTKGRSVAFAVASLSSGHTVFATCKHNILDTPTLSVFDERGQVIGVEGDGMKLLLSRQEDLDLALFTLPICVSIERIRLSTFPIEPNSDLSHAQNIGGTKECSAGTFAVTTKTTRKSQERAICSLGSGVYEFVQDDEGVRVAKQAGRKNFYGVLHMASRPGVSGSPLWDKYGAIRGMVCGGNDADKEEPKLIYVPTRSIEAELKILLANERLKRRS